MRNPVWNYFGFIVLILMYIPIYFQEHNDAVLIIAIDILIPQGPLFVFKNIPC